MDPRPLAERASPISNFERIPKNLLPLHDDRQSSVVIASHHRSQEKICDGRLPIGRFSTKLPRNNSTDSLTDTIAIFLKSNQLFNQAIMTITVGINGFGRIGRWVTPLKIYRKRTGGKKLPQFDEAGNDGSWPRFGTNCGVFCRPCLEKKYSTINVSLSIILTPLCNLLLLDPSVVVVVVVWILDSKM